MEENGSSIPPLQQGNTSLTNWDSWGYNSFQIPAGNAVDKRMACCIDDQTVIKWCKNTSINEAPSSLFFFFVSSLSSIPFPVLLWPVDHLGVWARSSSDTALAAAARWFPGPRELPWAARSPLLPPGTLASVPASQAQCPFSFSLLPSSLSLRGAQGSLKAMHEMLWKIQKIQVSSAGSYKLGDHWFSWSSWYWFDAKQNCRLELSYPSLRCSSVSVVPVVHGDE